MFTGVSAWDDEGTMMISVRFYLAGFRLYDEVFSAYGPVNYFYNQLIRSFFGVALDHDAVRMTSVVLMVACSFLSAWIVLRLTESVLAASVAQLLTFRLLGFFNNEPGVPQELAILLLIGLIAGSLLTSRDRRSWVAMILVGAMTAGLVLIKINIGIFVILAVALAIRSRSPVTVPMRIAGIAAAAAALILPLALMLNHSEDNLARVYCLVVTISIANLVVGLLDPGKTFSLSVRHCWIALASFVVVVATVWLVMLAQGVSVYGFLYSNVLIHLKMNILSRSWYFPLQLNWVWVPWACGGFLAAIFVTRRGSHQTGTAYQLLACIKLIFGAVALFFAALRPQSSALVGFLSPYAWLVLFPLSEEVRRHENFSRSLLAATAVLQTLYAYPIAGSQASFIQVLMVVVAAVCAGDFHRAWNMHRVPAAFHPLIRTAAIAMLLSVVLVYVGFAWEKYRAYEKDVPLALPGAERIHLPRQQAQTYHWLTKILKSHCDVFIGMPDLPSLYFWTEIPPATMVNMGNWMLSLNYEQQKDIIVALSKHPDACVVYNPNLFAFWIRSPIDTDKLPLVHYIRENFKSVAVHDNYFFMVRKERNLTVSSASESIN
jgi:hypothetical protein